MPPQIAPPEHAVSDAGRIPASSKARANTRFKP
jgi:hypothetical protein